jgi:hypothetical protein
VPLNYKQLPLAAALSRQRSNRLCESVPLNASALSEARFHESVKLGEVLCARSIEPFEGGRWWLRRMRANGWTRSNGYGN